MARRADRQRTTAQWGRGPKGAGECVWYDEKKGVKARSSPGAVDTPTDCLEQKEKKKVESIEQNAES